MKTKKRAFPFIALKRPILFRLSPGEGTAAPERGCNRMIGSDKWQSVPAKIWTAPAQRWKAPYFMLRFIEGFPPSKYAIPTFLHW